MSQNTRCPSCATLFKVVADQLRISDGWVRCGQCQQIFDAAANMQEVPESAPLADFDVLSDSLPEPSPAAQVSAEEPAPTPAPTPALITPRVDSLPAELPLADDAQVLEVPDPVVPAFLIASTNPEDAAPDSSTPPFAWQSTPAEPAPEPPLPEADFEWLEEYEAAPPAPTALEVLDVLEQPAEPAAALFEEAPSDFFSQLEEAPAELIPAEPEPEPEPDFFVPLPLPLSDSFDAEEASDWAANLELPPEPPSRTEPVLHEDTGAIDEVATEAEAETETETETPVEVNATEEAVAEPLADEPALAEALPVLPPLPDDSLEPSFVRTARRQAFWRQLEVRASLVLFSLLLVVVLALQVAVHQRNYLAAAQPQWRSALQTLCAPFQCKVAPYRDISSVVIDSSSFNKLQDDTYQFAVALKNTSGNALEIPAVELTLTNAQEQTVLRRVFTRKDLSAPRTLAARGDWSGTLQVELALDGAPIAGYRVLAFYP